MKNCKDEYGHCFMSKNLSNRQLAKSRGEAWYLPEKPCSKCGFIAEKRVNNGECRGCATHIDLRHTKDSIMMRLRPNTIMSKAYAIKNGFKVYRTGKSCKHGHTSFRYVSTGNCVTCVKNRVRESRSFL